VESRLLSSTSILRLPVPRHGDQPHMPTEQRSYLLRDLVAIEAGKTDVDQHNVWATRPRRLDALGPILGHVDAMPVHLQGGSKHLARIRVVLDYENVARATNALLGGWLRGGWRRGSERQPDHDFGASAQPLTVDRDHPAVELDEPPHQREANPQTSLGVCQRWIALREEIEHARKHLR